MITLLTATPGGGKTAFAVSEFILKEQEKAKREGNACEVIDTGRNTANRFDMHGCGLVEAENVLRQRPPNLNGRV
ncbi:hypothetical protein, partial [Parazoarcus communis]|uniref:hypothetical protein n=1 Tax=Parazoarcus communis TaxID=41977 RepID=UPI001B7D1CF2